MKRILVCCIVLIGVLFALIGCNLEKVTITFDGNGGTLISGQTVQIINKGASAEAPVYVKQGYKLDWDKSTTNLLQSEKITAIWTTNTYNVFLPDQNLLNELQCIITPVANSRAVNYGDSYSFIISSGLDAALGLIVKSNGITLLNNNDVYTINNIISDQIITIEKNMFSISFPIIKIGFTIETTLGSKSPVGLNGSYSFKVSLNENYSQSKIIVKSNGSILVADKDIYTISNITSNQVITIEGITINCYTVTSAVTGYSIIPISNNTIAHGSDYSFTVTPLEGYSLTYKVLANLEEILLIDGKYIIKNIMSNQVITIEQINSVNPPLNPNPGVPTILSYTITLPLVQQGYLINLINNSISPVINGGSFSFNVTLQEGYTQSAVVIKVNQQILDSISENNGTYTYQINNITNNKTITVEGVVINTYTVMFNTASANEEIESLIKEHGQLISQPSVITKTGYSFEGWYKQSNYADIWNFELDTVTADTIIYALWTINEYTITFVCPDADTSIDSITQDYNTPLMLPLPTRKKYEFIGWFTDSEFTKPFTSLVMIASDITLYAKWELEKINIIFDSNGGTSVSTITGDEGDSVTAPASPTKKGFSFLGWYSDNELSKPYLFEINNTIPSNDITLYAKWDCHFIYEEVDDHIVIKGISSQYSYLNTLEIPSVIDGITVTSIDEGAFFDNSDLISITISSSITNIGDFAFAMCSNLSVVIFEEGIQLENLSTYIFAYTNLINITIPASVSCIGEWAFAFCDNLLSVEFEIDSKLTVICAEAFRECFSLTDISIPLSVQSINNQAFDSCTGLLTVSIFSGVIGDFVFYGCISLQSVIIGANVTAIGNYTFYGCIALQSITISTNVTAIGAFVFYGCDRLTIYIDSYYFSNKPASWNTDWNNTTFWGCTLDDEGYVISFSKSLASITYSNVPSVTMAPSRQGYIFVGWSTEPDGIVIYSIETISEAIDDGTVYYAVWVK